MNQLAQVIAHEIDRQTIIPFARFMELALYAPGAGYYERTPPLGRAGDFYTSVSVGPLFGQLLALAFAPWLRLTSFSTGVLVEAGSHDGQLAKDLLSFMQTSSPALFDQLHYWIIEPSAARQKVQNETLRDYAPRVRWFESWDQLGRSSVTGVIFSNELLDALPVHRLGWSRSERAWFEWGVTGRPGAFCWERIPGDLAPELKAEIEFMKLPPAFLAQLPDGYILEISLAAKQWWQQAAAALQFGKLVAIDYGDAPGPSELPLRTGGTLRAYRDHRVCADLLASPGDQDLTANVNFSILQAAGEACGLRTELLDSQERFLTRAAVAAMGSWDRNQIRQFQTLTHPEHLGRAFKVLVQSR